MKNWKLFLMKAVTSAVFALAVTTVSATSRCFAYQPKEDAELMKKLLSE